MIYIIETEAPGIIGILERLRKAPDTAIMTVDRANKQTVGNTVTYTINKDAT